MDEEEAAAIMAAFAASVAVTSDKRAFRAPPSSHFSTSISVWEGVRGDHRYDGWYRNKFKCGIDTFTMVAHRIESRWLDVHPSPGANASFDIEMRVATTLYYLTNEGTYHAAGGLFGMSKTRCQTFVDEIQYSNDFVIQVLNVRFLTETIYLPRTPAEWEHTAADFEAANGVPNVVGAIDGSLFRIHRFEDFDGWYCRKGFPAFNMQAVVNRKMKFMSFSLRSGSQNDKGVFNRSSFGQQCHQLVPHGHFFVADAGYKLMAHVITPYRIYYRMPIEQSHFNYVHSRIRIVVEMAFGLFKSRFRVFKTALNHRTPSKMAQITTATIILHNWFIDSNDETIVDTTAEEWMHIGGDIVRDTERNLVGGSDAQAARETIKSM